MITKAKLTYRDYLDMPGEDRFELIDGELILVGSPNTAHQTAVLNLATRMNSFVKEKNLGRAFVAPFDVVFSDTDVVQPDLVFVSKEREGIITSANIQGTPDMLVEILSPSSRSRDWSEKRELYAQYGVQEYWIIDPIERKIWIMRLRKGALEVAGEYGAGDTAASSVVAGFGVRVDEIF